MPSLFSPSSSLSSSDKPKTRRWSSAVPLGPPPPSSPEHRKKPPRLSFHKSVSMTNIFEASPLSSQQPNNNNNNNNNNNSQSPTKARKMRNRLSSFLTTSPIHLKSATSLDKLTEDEEESFTTSRQQLLQQEQKQHQPLSPIMTIITESPRCSSTSTTSSSTSDDFLATPYEEFYDDQVMHHPISNTNGMEKENDYVNNTMGLAYMVRTELGSIMEQVDEEIEQEWEQSRRILRQSLSLPVVPSTSAFYRQ